VVSNQQAPGGLETVRELLNTWSIPNDTRTPTDRFSGPAQLRVLRDDLRHAVENQDPASLNPWISRLHMRPVIADDRLDWQGRGEGAAIVKVVLEAISDGTWPRLKACPDCRWVFYDNTRNGSKRWCLMTAGSPTGRSCGSIAKVRAHRERSAAAGR
jgi:hypothetical protein